MDPLHYGFTETDEPCGGGLPQGRPSLCFSREQSPFTAASSAHEGAVWSSRVPLPERDGVAGVSAEADLLDAGSLKDLLGGVASSAHHHHHPAQAIRTTAYQYNQRRSMSSGSGRGGHAPPPQGPYWKSGRTILKRPGFLPTHVPGHQASLKNWVCIEEVTGMVHEACLDATDLHIKFNPVNYLNEHPLLEEVPILGDPDGTRAWKFTENGKYSTKSLIDLFGTFSDIGCCIPSLSSDSVVLNSAGKFELIEAKTEFTDLTPEGVRKDYRNAVSLIEELIVASMGKQMLSLIPEDIFILFKFMRIDGYWYRHLIANHVSLLPLENRSAVFLAFFDYITLCIPNVNKKLKHKVKPYIPYRKLSAIMASNNWYLVEWLKFQDYNANKQFWGDRIELLQIVRNVIAHKLALLAKGERYEAEEVENMLHALYPRLLPDIQWFFWKEKLLGEFNLQSYFMDRKVTKDWPQTKQRHSR